MKTQNQFSNIILKQTGKQYITSAFVDTWPKPWIDGTETSIKAGEPTQLICYFKYFLDLYNITFDWFIGNYQLLGHNRDSFKQHADGSTTFSSVVLYNFTRKENGQALECSVSVEGRTHFYRNVSSVILAVHCM